MVRPRAWVGIRLCGGVTAACVVGALLGCMPTYAPPVRTFHGGAPASLEAGDMRLGGSLGPVGSVQAGAGAVAFAPREHLVVEGGIDGTPGWALGWAGVSVPARRHVGPRLSLTAEGEGGLGFGAGGESCRGSNEFDCVPDPAPWHDRLAGGGYLGAAGALRVAFVSFYLRARTQLTRAQRTPMTHWAAGAVGIHFHILRRADLWLGPTLARYANGRDAGGGFLFEAGVAFRFDPRAGWIGR